ncbi:hypothetical protein EVJ58_g4339 [Rhodofomes roseus]|uniref:Uncharacterized protein n=1 Tax=Rhodofomes roseus TaxID=34475 RepID=A0A4Y9YGM7_9APHY|nr:hypothetical protein EVJ58_g4339 [Rhodofomes roseus]
MITSVLEYLESRTATGLVNLKLEIVNGYIVLLCPVTKKKRFQPSVDAGSLTWLAYTSGRSEKAGNTGVACVTPLARPPHRPPPLELRFNLVAKYGRSILKASPSLPKDPEAATDMGWRTDTASGRAERVGGPQQACASTRERNEERMYVAELLLEYRAHSRAVHQAIERDAKDPQFMAMLSKLGPVKVDHHMQTVRPAQQGADQVQRVFQARQRSEEDARSLTPTRNRMLAGTLYELLEERKSASTREELEKLASRYEIDVDKLESVARFVNSPSVDEGSVRKEVDRDGVEQVKMKVRWSLFQSRGGNLC